MNGCASLCERGGRWAYWGTPPPKVFLPPVRQSANLNAPQQGTRIDQFVTFPVYRDVCASSLFAYVALCAPHATWRKTKMLNGPTRLYSEIN